SQRSKEDEVFKISTSVFVTNFPDQFNAKELSNTCKQYGFVVDAFIPTRRSKASKRFGFVHFINVFDAERLVNNLCTIWIGRYKIHANIAKNNEAKRNYTYTDAKGHANSYLHAVKGFQKPNLRNESNPVLVLDDSCLNQQYYSYCLLEVKKKFQSCTTISSWFSQIQQATCDFTTDGRVSWVEIEEPKGVMLGDSDVEAVPDTMFEVLPNANGGDAPSIGNKEMHSEDPFNIYDLLKVKKVPSAESLKYPLAISLDRFLSDHRPILLREFMLDYGPTPFRFFHYWIEVDGFVKMVEDTWNVALGDSSNAIFNLINKLMFLKEKIRAWKFEWKNSSKSHLISSKLELAHLDALIDNGEDLEIDVSNEEIKKAVWDCGLDKSPGPDGFTFGFYRHFWKLIEKDMVDAVKYFFKHGALPNGSNSSFIALIPKNPGANMVKDFRPISLIGSFYKIIAKILANRLIFILGDIVNEVQLAFVADRQILDCPFILNELFQWSKSKKKQTMIFKVDFEKAFDSIRCLRSSWGSIIVNGSPTDEFKFFKGLKQGDPFSPFLFIIIMESLHISFQRVVDAVHVLDCFYRASGLRINMCKSKLIGISVGEERVNQDASKIGCLALKAPFSYLGTKVRGIMSRIHSWKEIIDSMVLHLSKWKMKTLFIGGKLTLLKLVLGSMPIFYMFIFKVPMKVYNVWNQFDVIFSMELILNKKTDMV
nr:RNA-directed DNA polymerase, eukaryota, reverse transcriptase zinc-binding domain protein [Tanacetum cinerariifolium]